MDQRPGCERPQRDRARVRDGKHGSIPRPSCVDGGEGSVGEGCAAAPGIADKRPDLDAAVGGGGEEERVVGGRGEGHGVDGGVVRAVDASGEGEPAARKAVSFAMGVRRGEETHPASLG